MSPEVHHLAFCLLGMPLMKDKRQGIQVSSRSLRPKLSDPSLPLPICKMGSGLAPPSAATERLQTVNPQEEVCSYFPQHSNPVC